MSDVYVPIEVDGETDASRGVFDLRVHDEEGDRLVGSRIVGDMHQNEDSSPRGELNPMETCAGASRAL